MTKKQERHEARRAALLATLDRLLAMTLETRDNDWLWHISAMGSTLDMAGWTEFANDEEVQEKRRRAWAHYQILTADWPVVTC